MRPLVSGTLRHKETGHRPPGLHHTGGWAGGPRLALYGVGAAALGQVGGHSGRTGDRAGSRLQEEPRLAVP